MSYIAVIRADSLRLLTTVLSAVEGSKGVRLVSAQEEEEKEQKQERQTPNRKNVYVGGKRQKGISGRDLVLKTLREHDGSAHITAIKSAFIQNGFAGNSVSPNISEMQRDKLIKYVGSATYALVDTEVTVKR